MKNKKKLSIIGVVAVLAIVIATFIFMKRSVGVTGDRSSALSDSDPVRSYVADQIPEKTKGDMVLGDPEADLTIFVYEDYSSPYSAALADTLERIRAEADGRLAVVVRPYSYNSPVAGEAARAVTCAGEQGKWREMRALLFARAKNQQAADLDFSAYARQIGISEEYFQSCLTNQMKSGTMEQSARAAAGYGVMGAPTMFIGDEVILGARPYEDFTDSNGDEIIGLQRLIDGKLQ